PGPAATLAVVQGPRPPGTVAAGPGLPPAASGLRLAGTVAAVLVLLAALGGGWAALLVTASWRDRAALAPAVGIAVGVVAGVGAGPHGRPLGQHGALKHHVVPYGRPRPQDRVPDLGPFAHRRPGHQDRVLDQGVVADPGHRAHRHPPAEVRPERHLGAGPHEG